MTEDRTNAVFIAKFFHFFSFSFLLFLPAVQLLCLEQKDHFLKLHTRNFLDFENVPVNTTEPYTTPEPVPIDTDQVHETTTTPVPEGVLVELEDLDGSHAHFPTTESPDSTSVLLPIGSPLAQHSFNSTVACHPTSSTKLPRNSL